MFENIIVPLDGSTVAASVIPHVIAMARATDTKVTLLRVMVEESTTRTSVDPVRWQLQKTEAQTYLDEMRERLSPLLSLPPETVLLEGRTPDRIIEYARQIDCDLLILSSHGQGGISSWNVSSVAHKVIRRIGNSILLVRAYQMDGGQSEDPTAFHYRRIVVPLDGSLRAEHALATATALAEWHNAELMLVHVVTRPPLMQRLPLPPEESALVDQFFERNQSHAQRYMEQLHLRVRPEPQIHVITGDNTAAALHKFVTQHEADLLVMTAHGQSGQQQWPYGSLVASFIDHGATSLLVLQDMPANAIEPTAAELAAESLRRQPARVNGTNSHLGNYASDDHEIQVKDYAGAAI
jgi:nucleotide-binding universal stress UspA family protein